MVEKQEKVNGTTAYMVMRMSPEEKSHLHNLAQDIGITMTDVLKTSLSLATPDDIRRAKIQQLEAEANRFRQYALPE